MPQIPNAGSAIVYIKPYKFTTDILGSAYVILQLQNFVTWYICQINRKDGAKPVGKYTPCEEQNDDLQIKRLTHYLLSQGGILVD